MADEVLTEEEEHLGHTTDRFFTKEDDMRRATFLALLTLGTGCHQLLSIEKPAERPTRPLVLCADGQGEIAPDRDDILELSYTVCRFLDDWYVHRSQARFNTYVSAVTRDVGWVDAFRGAFTAPIHTVDPAQLELGVDSIEGMVREVDGIHLNPGNDRFAILKMGVSPISSDDVPEPGHPDHEFAARTVKALREHDAADTFFIAVYFVDGEGYLGEGMATFWIYENNEWKLLAFNGFD